MANGREQRKYGGHTTLERRFAAEYLVDMNASAAYARASLPRTVTKKTAGTNGSKMLNRPDIQELVKAQRDLLVVTAQLSAHDTLIKLKQLLMYDVRKLFHEDGKPKSVHELDDDTAMAVVGVDVVTTGNSEMGLGEVRKYKLADRVAALDKAMRYHNLFAKENQTLADALTQVTVTLIKAARGA